MGNKNSYIEVGQKMQWPKVKSTKGQTTLSREHYT